MVFFFVKIFYSIYSIGSLTEKENEWYWAPVYTHKATLLYQMGHIRTQNLEIRLHKTQQTQCHAKGPCHNNTTWPTYPLACIQKKITTPRLISIDALFRADFLL